MKLVDRGTGPLPLLPHLRGTVAAASLKLGGVGDLLALDLLIFRGIDAAASLKLGTPEVDAAEGVKNLPQHHCCGLIEATCEWAIGNDRGVRAGAGGLIGGANRPLAPILRFGLPDGNPVCFIPARKRVAARRTSAPPRCRPRDLCVGGIGGGEHAGIEGQNSAYQLQQGSSN